MSETTTPLQSQTGPAEHDDHEHVPPIGKLKAFWCWVRPQVHRPEFFLLAGAALVTALLFGFASMAESVGDGETHRVDRAILLALHDADGSPWGPRWLEEIGRDMTALGGVAFVTLLCVAVVAYLVFNKRYRDALMCTVPLLLGIVLSNVLKAFFERPRPDLVPHLSETYSSSFPSGHSLMAAVTYLTLAALVAEMSTPRRIKVFTVCLAFLLLGLVGVSRVYVGVHWPTDVLAGWTLGAAWALMCYIVVRFIDMRQGVKRDMIDVAAEDAYEDKLEQERHPTDGEPSAA